MSVAQRLSAVSHQVYQHLTVGTGHPQATKRAKIPDRRPVETLPRPWRQLISGKVGARGKFKGRPILIEDVCEHMAGACWIMRTLLDKGEIDKR